ncbi:unnamed protein product [Chilo suppressalis]|uniref:Ribosomal RNA-processing protein 8 n=1 Tax=Chilo suppressalis TaxID=168631 RepID=A0ABN8ARH8_CHISP|nr:unnamed protein product [Chilo suppressalis]
MFKIPSWGDDVPQSNIAFGKATKHKKQQNEISIPPSTTKPVKSLLNSGAPKNGKKEKHKKPKLNKNNNTSQISNQQFSNINLNKNQPGNKNNAKSSRKRKHKNISVDTNDVKNHVAVKKTDKVKKRKYDSDTLENTYKQVEVAEKVTNSISAEPRKKSLQPTNSKIYKKKERLRKILEMQSNRNQITVSGSNLRQRMLERLKAAQFRFLNEKLYTTSGSEAQKLFQSDPEAFHTYHQGYQQQLKKWPVNPLDLIVKRIARMPKTHLVADMGCGEAALSKRVQQKVRSFDLVSSQPGVETCDMAHTPLLAASVDVAVYCLALMGTDLTQYLVEANRVLKMGGHLLIAEVESRFEKVETFTEEVQRLGFKLKNLDKSHQVFFFMEFAKVKDPPAKKSKLPTLTLKPCLYKKR